MDQQADPQWLSWAKRLQAIAQNGLTYTRDHYDHLRYEELRELAAEMMAAGAGMPDSQKILDLFREESGYRTPKVEVRGAVIREDRILLVREREDGGWTMPGGWADVGETPSEMVVREVKEESGFDVKCPASWRPCLTATSILIRPGRCMPTSCSSYAIWSAAKPRPALRRRRSHFFRATPCPNSPSRA